MKVEFSNCNVDGNKKHAEKIMRSMMDELENNTYVKENKMKCKVRNWLKKNGNNKEYPKKWNKEEIELAEKMKAILLSF